MAVAIHTGKTNVMDYGFKEFDKPFWLYYKAWEVLKRHKVVRGNDTVS